MILSGIPFFSGSLIHRIYQSNTQNNNTFFNIRTSSLFGKNVLELLINTFEYSSEKHLISILFKLSAISCLFNAYEDLTHCNKPIKSYHIDSFIVWVK